MRMPVYYKVLIVISILTVAALSFELLTVPPTTEANIRAAEAYLQINDLPIPPNQFFHDGCTLAPDSLLWHNMRAACFVHDVAYWAGGPKELRMAADLELKAAIAHTGPLGRPLGVLFYASVRLFGDSPITKLVNANWGYGWNK